MGLLGLGVDAKRGEESLCDEVVVDGRLWAGGWATILGSGEIGSWIPSQSAGALTLAAKKGSSERSSPEP